MIKIFCDVCGTEVKDTDRLKMTNNTLSIEIMTAYLGTWNAGHFCKRCILDTTYMLDDRKEKS